MKQDHLLTKKNVVGYSVGEKWADGVPTGESALLVFVEKKEPLSALSASDMIDKEIDGMTTDVVGRCGKIKAVGRRRKRRRRRRGRKAKQKIIYNFDRQSKVRPILAGISISHPDVTAGTLGGIFMHNGKPVILTNNHVAANTNAAKIGDPIYQPGTYDGGRSRDTIGRLVDFVPLKNGVNQDSAIVSVDTSFETAFNLTNARRIAGIANPRTKMRIWKTGRTTAGTRGRVIGIGGTFSVDYGDSRPVYITVKDCIITTNISDGGDSGSLLMTGNPRKDANKAVGLLFAGSSQITLHSRIRPVMNHYGLTLP